MGALQMTAVMSAYPRTSSSFRRAGPADRDPPLAAQHGGGPLWPRYLPADRLRRPRTYPQCRPPRAAGQQRRPGGRVARPELRCCIPSIAGTAGAEGLLPMPGLAHPPGRSVSHPSPEHVCEGPKHRGGSAPPRSGRRCRTLCLTPLRVHADSQTVQYCVGPRLLLRGDSAVFRLVFGDCRQSLL